MWIHIRKPLTMAMEINVHHQSSSPQPLCLQLEEHPTNMVTAASLLLVMIMMMMMMTLAMMMMMMMMTLVMMMMPLI